MVWLNAYEHKPAKYLLVLCCLDEIGDDLILGYYDGVHWKSADGKLFIAPYVILYCLWRIWIIDIRVIIDPYIFFV